MSDCYICTQSTLLKVCRMYSSNVQLTKSSLPSGAKSKISFYASVLLMSFLVVEVAQHKQCLSCHVSLPLRGVLHSQSTFQLKEYVHPIWQHQSLVFIVELCENLTSKKYGQSMEHTVTPNVFTQRVQSIQCSLLHIRPILETSAQAQVSSQLC